MKIDSETPKNSVDKLITKIDEKYEHDLMDSFNGITTNNLSRIVLKVMAERFANGEEKEALENCIKELEADDNNQELHYKAITHYSLILMRQTWELANDAIETYAEALRIVKRRKK